jgi:hypothetical protein
MFKQSIKKFFEIFSLKITKINKINLLVFNSQNQSRFEEYYEICRKESLNVSKERFVSLYQALNYVYKNKIEGDFVECGVFMGGSAMMMAYLMIEYDQNDDFKKKIWLYDTYAGMANPGIYDENILNVKALPELKKNKKKKIQKIFGLSHL